MKKLTFAETLHPEDAQYHLGLDDEERRGWWRIVSNDIPTVVARPVMVDEDGEDDIEQQQQQTLQEDSLAITNNHNNQTIEVDDGPRRPAGKGCFYLEGLIGYILAFSAVCATSVLELTAAIVFSVAAGFYYITTFDQIGILFKTIFLLIVQLLLVIDALVLTVSVMVTELLGAISCIIAVFLVASCRSARDWPQYIRRMCHASRWVFRGFHQEWALQRIFPVDVLGNNAAAANELKNHHIEANTATNGTDTTDNQHKPAIMADNIVVVDHISYEDNAKK